VGVPQLGAGQVSGLAGIRAIATGKDHNLAVKSDGTVWQWGWTPTQWPGGPYSSERPRRGRRWSRGYYHSLALRATEQSGDGATTSRAN
jgi:alpha-tubulin suppressor-like RCC1 family protein